MPSLRDQMAHLSDFLNFESARAVAFRALHAHDEREPKPALGVDKLSHSDWIMVGGYYPLPVSGVPWGNGPERVLSLEAARVL